MTATRSVSRKSAPAKASSTRSRKPQAGKTGQPLQQICDAFAVATGWKLQAAPPAKSASKAVAGKVRLQVVGRSGPAKATASNQRQARQLAGALSALLAHTAPSPGRAAPRKATASSKTVARSSGSARVATAPGLAAAAQRPAVLSVSPATTNSTQATPAARFAALLRGGAQALKCEIAVLYTLDEAAGWLNPHAAYGLPAREGWPKRRKLSAAPADLEALCGYAVAIEPGQNAKRWNPPRASGAALCVPVASFDETYGTLWLFSKTGKQFSESDTVIAEMLAGRLAAELERTDLLTRTPRPTRPNPRANQRQARGA